MDNLCQPVETHTTHQSRHQSAHRNYQGKFQRPILPLNCVKTELWVVSRLVMDQCFCLKSL